ncbi:MFS transporter, partial [Atractiella rhizophila]
ESAIPAEEKRALITKVDKIILVCIIICNAFYYIDKTTLQYAAVFGLKDDLHLVGTEYSWLSSLFYFGWLTWAVPTNLLIQRLPVGKYLAFSITIWGVLLMCQAACKSFGELGALRFLSGMAEGTADPAFMIITGMWYTRKEQPLRMGIWFSAIGIGIALGGLLGYGIGSIPDSSIPSWKYEFLIIGALCFIWGVTMFWVLPDSPANTHLFTKKERMMQIARIQENQTGLEDKHFKWDQVKETFTSVPTLLYFAVGISSNLINGGISNFGTQIIKGFGFSTLTTTVLQVPYGFFAFFWVLGGVFINHHCKNKRAFIAAFSCLPNIAGALGLMLTDPDQKVPRLICYYLTAPFNLTYIMVLSLIVSNTAGHTKKILTSAVTFVGMATGNLAGPFFYKTEEAPVFNLGLRSMLISILIEFVACVLLGVWYWYENRRREAKAKVGGGVGPEKNETAFADLTDVQNPNFRYVY